MANATQDNSQTFSGGQPDPNAGASGSFDPSQINPQTMALLQTLLQSSQQQQNTPAMSMVGQNSQPAVGNVQGQQVDPQMQKSAQKALSQYYDQHAQAALNHPDGIKALTSIANGGQQSSQLSPQQTLGSILPNQGQPLGTNQVNNPSILSPQNAFQNPAYNPQTGQIQEGGWVNRGVRGLAEGGIPGLLGGLIGPSLGAQMGATEKAQVLKAGQPAEIAEPAARAKQAQAEAQYTGSLGQQVQQELKGLTPQQQQAARVALTQQARENDVAYTERLQDQLKGAQQYQEMLVKNTSVIGRKEKLDENEKYMNLMRNVLAKKTIGAVKGNNTAEKIRKTFITGDTAKGPDGNIYKKSPEGSWDLAPTPTQ